MDALHRQHLRQGHPDGWQAQARVGTAPPSGDGVVARRSFPARTGVARAAWAVRGLQVAQPLVTTLLCVSKKEVFLQAWMPFMESCLRQFKVRAAAAAAAVRRPCFWRSR